MNFDALFAEWKTKYEETYGIFPSDEELMKILDVKKEVKEKI